MCRARRSLPVRRPLSGESGQEVADLLLARNQIGKRQVGLDRVVVTAAGASSGHVSGVGELGDDAVGGALGDPDRLADLAEADAGVMLDMLSADYYGDIL